MRNRLPKANGLNSQTFRSLTRTDLTAFDRESKDLIMRAIDAGCLARVSSKGHCIIRNNVGGTAAVPRNMTAANRTAQNARSSIRRLLSEHRQEAPKTDAKPKKTQRTIVSAALVDYGPQFSRWLDEKPGGLPPDQEVIVRFDDAGTPTFSTQEEPSAPQPLTCPDCDKTFATAAARGSHARIHRQQPQETDSMQDATVEPPSAQATSTPQTDIDADAVIQRIRETLGPDPRVAELEARNAELEEQLDRARKDADELRVRLNLIQEALHA